MKLSDNTAAALKSLFALLEVLIMSQSLILSYRHQHGHGHGSHTTRHRSDESSLILGRGIVDITHYPLPAGSAII